MDEDLDLEKLAALLEDEKPSVVLQSIKGDSGEKGEKGDKGDKGDKGERGEKGEQGERGLIGYPGLKGDKGEDGRDGKDGKDAKETELEDVLDKLRPEVFSRFTARGGGAMGRNIAVGGNQSVLSKYTDINIIPGSNITITYANNNSTRFTDITISASGGGGGGGISRSINSISTSTAAGSASSTDYVYLCTGTLTVTMPDATLGNTNLYTVKNVGTGVITIATTAGQTIDGQSTIQMATQYTSVDLESDTMNWNIT